MARRTLIFSVALHLASAVYAGEPAPALNFDPDNLVAGFVAREEPSSNATLGWSFELTEPAVVTHLGFFDDQQDGLSAPQLVGLLQQDSVLAQVQLDVGDAAPLAGGYRVAEIDHLRLLPGYYMVGASHGLPPIPAGFEGVDLAILNVFFPGLLDPPVPDPVLFWNFDTASGDGSAFVPNDSRVDVGRSLPSFSPTAPAFPGELLPPTSGFLVTGAFIGPMIFLAPVPEPSTVGLLLVGGWQIAFRRSR